MKYLIIFIVLSFCGALVYMRLRPYIAVVRRALGFIRAARQLNVNERPSSVPTRSPAATNERLVRCAACGAWLPNTRALILRATNTSYCSPDCLERAAADTSRKTANGNT